MTYEVGRDISISVGGSTIAVGRTKTFTVNNTSINVTTDGDEGVQKLLAQPGEKAISFSIDGLYDADEVEVAIVDLALSTTDIQAELIITYAGYTITGDFNIENYSEGMPYQEATTFTADFNSASAITKADVS